MTACEQGEAIDNRVDVLAQLGVVCRIAQTLRALRAEERRADPDAAIARAAVRKYAAQFSRQARVNGLTNLGVPGPSSRTSAGGAAEAASDPFIADATDPFADPAEE
jgi:hypothetical protein